MAETIFSAVVLLLCASPLIILGIVQYRSKEPVGFWAGKEPPRKEEVTDVRAYNRKHGLMWILYGLGLTACFVWIYNKKVDKYGIIEDRKRRNKNVFKKSKI